MRLLGQRDLKAYIGWKPDEALVRQEYERNRQRGQEQATWLHRVVNKRKKTRLEKQKVSGKRNLTK